MTEYDRILSDLADEVNAAHVALSDLDVPVILEGKHLSLPERIAWLDLTRPKAAEQPQRPRFVPPADREVPSLRDEALRILGEAGVELPPGEPLSFATLDEMGLLTPPPGHAQGAGGVAMTTNQGRHYPKNLMRCSTRPEQQYGDVDLSVQASRFHRSTPCDGCGHTPLEMYERLEVALIRANAKTGDRWIRQPSRELGIDGFDDLWCEEVPIAEYVPQDRVQALRAALAERARPVDGRAPERAAVPDYWPVVDQVDVDAIDLPPATSTAQRQVGPR